MKTKFKLIISLMLCVMMVTSVCSAAIVDSYSVNDEKEELTVFGSPTGVEKGDNVRVQLLDRGKTSSQIAASYTTGEQLLDDFIFVTQIPAEENGEYTVTIGMAGRPSDYYVLRVNGEEKEIFYATKQDKEAIIDDNDATVGDDIKSICARPESEIATAAAELITLFDLTNERSVVVNFFVITDEKVFAVTPAALFTNFYKVVNASEEALSTSNLNEKLYLAAYITALDEGKAEVIDYVEEFGFEDEYVDVYNNKLTATAKTGFSEKYFKGKKYDSVEDVCEAFNKGALTEWCNDFSGWADIQEFIDTFGAEVGVNMEDYAKVNKSKLYAQLLDLGSFSNTDDFGDKANGLMKKLLSGGTGLGGGGTSGGGSGSGGGGTAGGMTNLPAITPDEATANSAAGGFTDLAGFDWAVEAIAALADKNIVNGTGEGTYEPASEVKREEILAMLLRAFEVAEEEADGTFTDVEAGGWYKGIVETAKKLGFVNGKPDGTFGIGEAVTREDVSVMAYNIAKAKGIEFNTEATESFADDTQISSYAKDAVYALKNAGVLNGKGEGRFDPKATCTRAEAAKIIYTLISK